jgi:hypothetical protein
MIYLDTAYTDELYRALEQTAAECAQFEPNPFSYDDRRALVSLVDQVHIAVQSGHGEDLNAAMTSLKPTTLQTVTACQRPFIPLGETGVLHVALPWRLQNITLGEQQQLRTDFSRALHADSRPAGHASGTFEAAFSDKVARLKTYRSRETPAY